LHYSDAQVCSVEYSFNFRRHVVRRDVDGVVLESFAWYDEARRSHPQARTLPCMSVSSDDEEHERFLIAGASPEEASHYETILVSPEQNRIQLSHILQERLKWFPQQIDRFLSTALVVHPNEKSVASCYPAAMLQERLDFLLAPLVPIEADPALQSLYADSPSVRANYDELVTCPVDWPLWLYGKGRGAGMSIAQVSHALHTLPSEILCLPPSAAPHHGKNSSRSNCRRIANRIVGAMDPKLMAFLYDQTPAVVMEMTPKQLDPRMAGVTNLGCASVAYLHWKGWEWKTCRLVVDAIGCFSELGDVDSATWDPSATRGSNRGRSVALEHLQGRLQLQPWQVRAMVRTHPKLAGYSMALLDTSIDVVLRQRLGFTSAQVQRIALKMPSLLGVSEEAVSKRVDFWTQQVGLTMEQLRYAILGGQKRSTKLSLNPSLLAYSLENLLAKLHFFRETLQIQTQSLSRMAVSHPDLWGRSLDRHYKPLVEQFCQRLNLTDHEFGRSVASRAPYLLKCNWNSLCAKMDFLQTRLGLSDADLRTVVKAAPMLLLSSIREMELKLEMLAKVATKKSTVTTLIVNNPSLLHGAKSQFEKRLNRVDAVGDESLLMALGGTKRRSRDEGGATQRARRAVWLLEEEFEADASSASEEARSIAPLVQAEFSSVGEAAVHAGVSTPTMYRLLRARKSGFLYVYAGSALSLDNVDKAKEYNSPLNAPNGTAAPFIICAASRAYPATRIVRGHRRGGGMALFSPGWTSAQWKALAPRVWKGQEDRIRLLKNGCLVLGYPYTRPSQRRCSLYVAREALRVAVELSITNPRDTPSDVVVVTDSHYVLDLLKNGTKVAEWGEAETAAAFQYDGPLQRFQANVDILYPLARTWFNLATRNCTVSFAFSLEYPGIPFANLAEGARLAAKHMFEQI
jgi:mTERF